MIVILNGAFGIGKTTVARALVRRMHGSLLFDPELIGLALQRGARLTGRPVPDFQDLPAWRTLTVAALRLARMRWTTIIVPMAISNPAYLSELRVGLARFEPRINHFCLVAPVTTVHARLRERGATPEANAWEFRRAAECCDAHRGADFGIHIDARFRGPELLALHLEQWIREALPRLEREAADRPA